MSIMRDTTNYTFKINGVEKKLTGLPNKMIRDIQKETGMSVNHCMIECAHRMGQLSDEEYAATDVSAGKKAVPAKRKAPARKVDVDKRDIVSALSKYLQCGEIDAALGRPIDSVIVENDQRLITFTVGEDTYSLTLARKRAPKA